MIDVGNGDGSQEDGSFSFSDDTSDINVRSRFGNESANSFFREEYVISPAHGISEFMIIQEFIGVNVGDF